MFNKVDDRIPSSVFNASRTDQSRKPGGIRELIKAVSPGPHIELLDLILSFLVVNRYLGGLFGEMKLRKCQ